MVKSKWENVLQACNQKDKIALGIYFDGKWYHQNIKFLSKLFDFCLLCEDNTCLEFALQSVAERFNVPVCSLAYNFNLPILAMMKNKKCFEYLVSILNNLNYPVCYHSKYKPLLHFACENLDDVAVGILLKYGANVNHVHYTLSPLEYALCSFETTKIDLLKRIVQMLLFVGANADCVKLNVGLAKCPLLPQIIAARDYGESCY